MPYQDPRNVDSPKNRWQPGSLNVLCDTGQRGWAVAEGIFDGDNVLAIRWNGDDEGCAGNPQSHGHPTWFIVPCDISVDVRSAALKISKTIQMVKCEITHPAEYDPGAFKVYVETMGVANSKVANIPSIPFHIPRASQNKWRVNADPSYRYVINKQLHGQLAYGKFEGHLYSYSTDESDNFIACKVARDAIISSVINAISPLIYQT